MRQNIFSNIFWGLLEYIGLLIPNIVTTWWLTISSFESALVNLYLLTTFGLVAQTLYFIHEHNLFKYTNTKVILFLSLIVLALIGLLGHYNGTLISIWIYMIILVFLSIIVCFSLSNPSK
jgi:hypothetical protein